MKYFNSTIFILSSLIVALLLVPALFAALGEDDGMLRSDDAWGIFFVHVFHVLRFPTHTLLWPIISAGGTVAFFVGLALNCMFYGILVERVVALLKSVFRRNAQ